MDDDEDKAQHTASSNTDTTLEDLGTPRGRTPPQQRTRTALKAEVWLTSGPRLGVHRSVILPSDEVREAGEEGDEAGIAADEEHGSVAHGLEDEEMEVGGVAEGTAPRGRRKGGGGASRGRPATRSSPESWPRSRKGNGGREWRPRSPPPSTPYPPPWERAIERQRRGNSFGFAVTPNWNLGHDSGSVTQKRGDDFNIECVFLDPAFGPTNVFSQSQ
ncbi:hypothetical protein BHM03_00059881 [Ensete ventricosum]|nr:hypothetical protein BHM03_00059881 [Ensete ventricosum]